MKGLIAAGGTGLKREYLEELCRASDIIVAADSGLYSLLENDCRIDFLIGDFDSISDKGTIEDLDVSIQVIKYPIEKDKTDTELAIDLLIQQGCDEIAIIGAIGSRMDHSMSNIYLLRRFHRLGIKIRIIDNNNEISYLSGENKLVKEMGYYHSILPVGPEGITVTLEGFHYSLKKELIQYGSSLGISNYLEEPEGSITVHSGEGFLIKSRD